jgi:hypothetical protein
MISSPLSHELRNSVGINNNPINNNDNFFMILFLKFVIYLFCIIQ